MVAGLLLGSAAMQAAASRIAAIVDIRVQNGIQAEVYDCILRTDWVSLEQFRSGDLLNRLNTDVGAVAGGVTGLLPSFVSAAVQFLGSLIIILCYDPVMRSSRSSARRCPCCARARSCTACAGITGA